MSRSGAAFSDPVRTAMLAVEKMPSPDKIMEMMEVDARSPARLAETIPFSVNDTTAGAETELQAVVAGKRSDVDLAVTIERSNYYANILRRAAAGDTSRRMITDLERFMAANTDGIWENSWVRFPRRALSPFANDVFNTDLLADKRHRAGGLRTDTHKFIFTEQGEEYLRTPISYLLKLALADAVSADRNTPQVVKKTGCGLMDHFLSDNTSPETHSFWVVRLQPENGMGKAIAGEASTRFLLTQLLVMYANRKFDLTQQGQKAMVFSSPHPPIRQKQLNDCISDAFYRELFMNPCLSGWDKGEAKHDYMHLCHGVLSRSQLNAVAKLKEAGILTGNLAILPNLSNISLANNGTHLSMGSLKMSRSLADPSSRLNRFHEKYLGDLIIKMSEHFLPLFTGTYSAAPYRLDFPDFHPEKVLGFLPHELDYTHLRMFWRRWKKKAQIKILGRPVTPFGPIWLDRIISRLFSLRGDFVPDFRLIDYPVMLMSTDESPALDGRIGNSDRLKKDLSDLGIFDAKMSLYLLYKLREFGVMGFFGFEGRHYSLFENMEEDMGKAADLQNLINALAFKTIALGRLDHADIPDDPFIESERRQIIFGAAAGIPTFFVRADTKNVFLKRILRRTAAIRQSRRYPGYLRVYNTEYRKALARMLMEDAGDLIEMMNLGDTMKDLMNRLEHPEVFSTAARLTRGILEEACADSPVKLSAAEFNRAAETYYRDRLCRQQMDEAFQCLETCLLRAAGNDQAHDPAIRAALHYTLNGQDPVEFLRLIKGDVMEDRISLRTLAHLIYLTLIHIHLEQTQAKAALSGKGHDEVETTPVLGAGNR